MYQASTQLNNAILGDSRSFRTKIEVAGQIIYPGTKSISIQAASNSGDCISIGGTPSAYITVSMQNEADISVENQEITLYLGIDIGSDTENFEYIKMGLFTVQKPQNDDGLLTFTAYDRMASKLCGAYFSKLTYPADAKDVLREISTLTGVPVCGLSELPDDILINQRTSIKESDVDESGNTITSTTYTNPFDGYSYREALGYIAQLFAKYAVINRNGEIELRWYQEVDYTVTASRYYNDLVTNEKNFELGMIECVVGDQTLSSGSGTAGIRIDSPIMTQERLDWIFDQLKDFTFLPASLSYFGDPRIDLGDIVRISDRYGNIIKLPVMTILQDFDGGLVTAIGSVGRTETESNTIVKGPTAQALDRVYQELFFVKEIVGNKANFDYAKIIDADIKTVRGDLADYKTIITEEFAAQTAQINTVSGDLATYKTMVAQEFTATNAQITQVSGELADYKTIVTEDFTAVNGQIDTLSGELAEYKQVVAGDITAVTGQIEELSGDLADYKTMIAEDFTAVTGRIDTLSGELAEYKQVVAGNFTAINGQIENLSGEFLSYKTAMTQELIAAKGWMLDGSIGNAQIQNVSANKIGAGTLDTAVVTVKGSNGNLQIIDNTMTISDVSRVRVQVGKDVSGDYTLAVWDASGKLIWDALGATENTIQRPIIRDEAVADDAAIKGTKLDIESVVAEVNGAATKISSTVVQVGDKTLTAAFSEQTQVLDEYGQTLTTHAAAIEANENAIGLRVTSAEYESYKDGVDSRFSDINTGIDVMNGRIDLKVTQVDIDAAIQKIKIGAVNLLKKSKTLTGPQFRLGGLPALTDETGSYLYDELGIVMVG